MKQVVLNPEQVAFILACVDFAQRNAEVGGWGPLGSFEEDEEHNEDLADQIHEALT